jgi:hypothetical protein
MVHGRSETKISEKVDEVIFVFTLGDLGLERACLKVEVDDSIAIDM